MKTTHGKRTRNAHKRTQVVYEGFYKKRREKQMNREDMKQILSNIYALQVKGMQMQCPCCGNEMRVDINENSLRAI